MKEEHPLPQERESRRWRFGRGVRFRRRRRLTNIAILPTLITLGNLVCGTLSLFYAADGFARAAARPAEAMQLFQSAAWFILLAMVFDALDGRVARMTRTASTFGAMLDSLCDLVSFGVAPAFLVHSMCRTAEFAYVHERLVNVVCVFYAVCTAVRLARFNVETSPDLKSHLEFTGLPSPASAGVVAAAVIPWSAYQDFHFLTVVSRILLKGLPVVMLVLAVLMISRVHYAHVLNKIFRGYRPFVVFVEVCLVGVLSILFHEFAIFLAFVGYAVSGPVLWIRTRLTRREPVQAPEFPSSRDETLF